MFWLDAESFAVACFERDLDSPGTVLKCFNLSSVDMQTISHGQDIEQKEDSVACNEMNCFLGLVSVSSTLQQKTLALLVFLCLRSTVLCVSPTLGNWNLKARHK